MNFSEQWLQKWINPLINIKKICEQLTLVGLEAEVINNIPKNFHNIIVGEIINSQIYNLDNQYNIYTVLIDTKISLKIIS
ncbi:hypothetical protein HIC20_02540, partial [Buchnera aphidicola (Hormaphis cornu)]